MASNNGAITFGLLEAYLKTYLASHKGHCFYYSWDSETAASSYYLTPPASLLPDQNKQIDQLVNEWGEVARCPNWRKTHGLDF